MKNRPSFILIFFLALGVFGCASEVTKEGDSLFNDGKYTEAVEAYSDYLKTRPKDIKTLYNRGRAYEELGQVEKARADFDKILDLDQDNLNANLSMGKYWYNKKNFDQAINFFDRVIVIDGRRADAYLLKGRAFHQQGEFEEAMENYNQAISFDRQSADAFLYRGALKVALNQNRSACNDLNRAKILGSEEAATALSKYCK